ncbi:hypothetical protein MUK42_26220 [Musa troglodytarum]|uniref:Uncharacterized protein n=1 Tax=Musa troglodytarum TaxID=320322 RepID=A0A9E7EDK6_9LILI|nr:hypothetical protein MUK42_26220 [Musa troglodytarum]
MLRDKRQNNEWSMGVGWRELEREAPENGRECQLSFHRRKVLADAIPRAAAEGKEDHLVVLACVGHPLCKPLRIELAGIFAPDFWIVMKQEYWQSKQHSWWAVHVPNTVLGMKNEDSVWSVSIRRREIEGEMLKNHAQSHLCFQQRKVLADANSRASAEREERNLFLRRLRDPLGEPLWIELTGIFAPHVWIVVDEDYMQQEENSRWVNHIPELHRLVRLPPEENSRRV